jgi:DNA-binding NarL/FixJ family response regulator
MASELEASSLLPEVVVASPDGVLVDDEDFVVRGQVSDPSELFSVLDEALPDVLLLDLAISSDSLALLDEIDARTPETEVIAVAASDDPELVAAVLERGVRAYVVKTAEPLELGPAIRCAIAAAQTTRPAV